MNNISESIPFYWRLSTDNGEGFCAVSMVVPFNSGTENLEHTIETNVLSFISDYSSAVEEETLEWNEDDINLFLRLVSNRACAQEPAKEDSIKVDLADPETIEIVKVVAAAGFGMPQAVDESLVDQTDLQLNFDCEVGSPVSLHTVKGYKRCIVVDVEDDEVVCVMLDTMEAENPLALDESLPHELLLVKRYQLMHPLFTSSAPSHLDVLH